MGIDLCSKRFQLKFLKSYFVFVNFTDQTTTKISDAPISGYASVTVHKYVDGEEHDAKLLFGGEVTGDYWIDIETGEVEDLNAEETE